MGQAYSYATGVNSTAIVPPVLESVEPVEIKSEIKSGEIIKLLEEGKYTEAFESIKTKRLVTFEILLEVIKNSELVSQEVALLVVLGMFAANPE
jgi:hypothetical protein